MQSQLRSTLYLFLLLMLGSCSVNKNLPSDQYLLAKVNFDIDTRSVNSEKLKSYIRQEANSSKVLLNVYNLVQTDSTKWFNKQIQKLGEAPVLYDHQLTGKSIIEMKKELSNLGYYHTQINANTDTLDRKINLTYHVNVGNAHVINKYTNAIEEARIDSMLQLRRVRGRSIINKGDNLDLAQLETEQNRIVKILHNRGYFDLDANNLYFEIDTLKAPFQADVTLNLNTHPHLHLLDSVIVLSGFDPMEPNAWQPTSTMDYKGLHLVYDSSKFLRPSSLFDNITLRPKMPFSDRRTQQTYTFLNALGVLSRSQIVYTLSPKNDTANDIRLLNATIMLSPGQIHGIQTGIEGTNKAGDLGIAGDVTYTHYNLFNGAEKWTIKLRSAYEFVNASINDILTENYYEIGGSTSLSFPQAVIPFVGAKFNDKFSVFKQYAVGLDMQRRAEYMRNFFNLSWKYKLENEKRNFTQTWTPININYIFMPVVSDRFQEYLDQNENSLSKFSYDNVFIAGIGYDGIYTKPRLNRGKRDVETYRFGIETSGNLLRGLSNLFDATPNAQNQYLLFKNPFAQYVIADFDFTRINTLSPKIDLAFHFEIGAAFAYTNSKIMPFEKRYYAGGPNSIRGWVTRTLGPGSLNIQDANALATHVGDLKLELSFEYRYRWFSLLEVAGFVDAGNIWTLRNYNNQPQGQITSDFYKQLAMGAGAGFRFDLTFLVMRIDFAKKVYDPAQINSKPFVFFDSFTNNFGLYLAIGYPF